MADTIIVEGYAELKKDLDRLLMSDRSMEKKVQQLIRRVLMEARSRLAASAQSGLQMKSDPRKAYKAVRSAVYRQILGGNVNILAKRRAGAPGNYEPQRTLTPGQRGGNRVPRSARTKQVDGYQGADRGFILRFLNAGTEQRTAGTRGGRLSGNRGAITPRNWFGTASQQQMERAADWLASHIENLIQDTFYGENG